MSLSSRLLTIVAIVAATASPSVYASGYYNMPTSMQQCLGLGYGPGYHAPLLLGRSYKANTATQRVRRLPAPLSPPPTYGFSSSNSWTTPCEGGSCGGPFSSTVSVSDNGSVSGSGSADGHRAVSGPTFAPPTLFVPQQATMPQPPFMNNQGPNVQGRATGPIFPSARASQKPPLLW